MQEIESFNNLLANKAETVEQETQTEERKKK